MSVAGALTTYSVLSYKKSALMLKLFKEKKLNDISKLPEDMKKDWNEICRLKSERGNFIWIYL